MVSGSCHQLPQSWQQVLREAVTTVRSSVDAITRSAKQSVEKVGFAADVSGLVALA